MVSLSSDREEGMFQSVVCCGRGQRFKSYLNSEGFDPPGDCSLAVPSRKHTIIILTPLNPTFI